MTSLERLYLDGCLTLDEDELEALLRACKKAPLAELDASDCPAFTKLKTVPRAHLRKLVLANCTKFTDARGIGEFEVLDRAQGDPRKAERGIVFIDEIDKIRRGDVGGAHDISGEGVQNALLTLLDGRLSSGEESSRHPEVDTARLLFICTGAFVGLDEIVRARMGMGRARIGFPARPEEKVETVPDRPVYEALCQAQTADLMRYGMIPEFVGRFATVSVLHELSRADLRAIMGVETERSPLSLQRRLAEVHGIDLVVADGAPDAITAEAEALGTGARGLHRLIGKTLDAVDYRWPELADGGVRQVGSARIAC